MINVTLHIMLALGIMITTAGMVIHRLLISGQLSDKLYKNFGFAILGSGAFVSCAGVLETYIENNWMIERIRARDLSFEKLNDMANDFITNLNAMTLYLIAAIVFYILALLVVKSIIKDIEKDASKPKYRWSKLDKDSTDISGDNN